MDYQVKKLYQQPLLHFLVIGALLFAFYYKVNPAPNNKDTIVINDDQIERLVTVFQKEWNRTPSENEMKGLLDRYIEQEIYYRKALRMNLDQNDEIIRRRMEQKLKFVTNDMANLTQPNAEALQQYYQKNKTKYLEQKKYSFFHIYFNPDKRQHPKEDADILKSSLPNNNINIENLVQKGDPFPFNYHIDSLTKNEINKTMGDSFTDELDKLPLNKWAGPILSGYGMHLIYITTIQPTAEKDFDLIKDEVLRDYHYDLQNDYNNQLFAAYKKDYTIKLEINDPKNNKPLITKLLAVNGN